MTSVKLSPLQVGFLQLGLMKYILFLGKQVALVCNENCSSAYNIALSEIPCHVYFDYDFGKQVHAVGILSKQCPSIAQSPFDKAFEHSLCCQLLP